ncbi:MAG TPA: PKD domain-containing protein [Chitinophagaceae bacterium]|nr:PKD domain-containing protein [Chitinophagaceae bacterium]
MKKSLLIFLLFQMTVPCMASHIIGGEMTYMYIGQVGTNSRQYTITLKLFRDQNCSNCAQMPSDVFIGIFNNDDNTEYPGNGIYYDVIKTSETTVPVDPFPPCITDAPVLDYHVATFTFNVTLPNNTNGYTATYQTCCRVQNLENVYNNLGAASGTGSTYSCSIPAIQDDSPLFATKIDAICRKRHFTLSFNATDADGDSLVYYFIPAYRGGALFTAANINPAPPPYGAVTYINGFSFTNPLGPDATIDPATGIISGTAPDVGKYVVGVAVAEYRNGVFLAEHRKDFIVTVTDCDFAGVQLDPQPVSCDGFSVTFSNDNNSSLNKTFYWDFGDPASGVNDTSTLESPTHVYTDTGTYVYKLVVNKGQQCSDSATQIRKVYPGFSPGFTTAGECVNTAIQFTDTTKSKYGLVNAWRWDFGDPAATGDTSIAENPAYTYAKTGSYVVGLTVSNSKGCTKTVDDTIAIIDKPALSITDDTLICSIDTLQLMAAGHGTIFWTPNYNINSQSSFNPLVSPKTTTTYSATLTEAPGCFTTKSVVVNVIDKVTLNAGNDTTICQTDSVRLNTVSDGLHYVWTPANSLSDPTARNPNAAPSNNTTYHVIASVGKCSAADDITIRVVPYPKAGAGADTTICFSTSAQLHASGGSSYVWTPAEFINNSNIADPVVTPPQSILYIVAVTDTFGCPKPAYDSVLITVQKLVADAGPADTNVVVGQPLQLNGTGGDFYTWTPSTGLNNDKIADPVAILSNSQQYVLTVQSKAGCVATDTIDVIVYKVDPGLYVPNAFTPNGDGINDIFRPILIGMKSLTYFRVYNRLGQLVFSTTQQKIGWDGTFKGLPQDPDVYVWMVEGIDYQNKVIFRKGSVTLIR